MADESDNQRSRYVVVGVIAVVIVAAIFAWQWRARTEAERDASAAAGDAHSGGRSGSSSGAGSGADSGAGTDGVGEPGAQTVAVYGSVTTADGAPISGARVCATAKRFRLGPSPRCTASDDEGRYHLASMPAATYLLTAAAAEHQPKSGELTLAPGAERSLDFVLLAGGVLVRGTVYDLAGGEVEGALVSIDNDSVAGDPDQRSVVISDASGEFEAWVRRGRVKYTARAPGYSHRWLYSSAPGPTVELYLVPECVIVGRVVDADTGVGVADVEVHPGAVGPMAMMFTDTAVGWARTDGEGRFRIEGLEPGSFEPMVVNGRYRGHADQEVALGLGETSDPVEIAVARAATVHARVVDERGEPTCADELALLSPAPFETYVGRIDDEGHVEIGGLEPGDYRVKIDCAGRLAKGFERVSVAASADVDGLRWVVPTGLEIRGTVVAADGRPLPGVVVVGEHLVEGGRTARTTRAEPTDLRGQFALRRLAPGPYALELGGSAGPSLAEPVELELGQDGVDGVELVAAPPSSLAGRVLDSSTAGVANITVTVSLDDGLTRDTHSGDDGSFAFDELRAGRYRVSALDGRWGIELASESIELSADAPATLDLVVPRADGVIRGRVVDDGGTPLDDAFIAIERQAEALAEPPSERLSYSDAKGRPVLTDPDGGFEIEGLPDGLYTIHARQRQGGSAVLVDARPGQTVELKIEPPGADSEPGDGDGAASD